LESLEREVLEGDWGGYYESFRRPLIQRLDTIRETLGEAAPERAEDAFTRPAPPRHGRRNWFESLISGFQAESSGAYELTLYDEGRYTD
ncbi:unnamed protein product, partial [Heterosigma akashiwo]